MKLTEKEFCKMVQEFDGEPINNLEQIQWRKFNGQKLKEFIEHCLAYK